MTPLRPFNLFLIALVVLLDGCSVATPDEGVPPPDEGVGPVETFPDQGRDHLAAGDPSPEYNSNPPTSGPHAPVFSRCGVHNEEIAEVVQVHDLEHGVVLVQYAPELSEEDQAALEEMVSGYESHLIVAARAGLPAPVTLTAWTVMLRLDEPDADAIRQFWDEYAQRGPEQRRCPIESP